MWALNQRAIPMANEWCQTGMTYPDINTTVIFEHRCAGPPIPVISAAPPIPVINVYDLPNVVSQPYVPPIPVFMAQPATPPVGFHTPPPMAMPPPIWHSQAFPIPPTMAMAPPNFLMNGPQLAASPPPEMPSPPPEMPAHGLSGWPSQNLILPDPPNSASNLPDPPLSAMDLPDPPLSNAPSVASSNMQDSTAALGQTSILGDLILYADKVANRAAVGANVQKDHGISQAIIKNILGPLKKLYKPGRDLTTVVETGAASSGTTARWHTLKSTLEKPVQAAVQALTTEGRAFSIGEHVVEPMADVLKTASGAAKLSRQQYLGMLSQLGNLHATTTAKQAGQLAAIVEGGDAAKLSQAVDKMAKSTTGVAKWMGTLRNIAKGENAIAAVAKVAPAVSKCAPAAKFLGKAAGPAGIVIGVGQIALSKTTEGKIDGGITATSSALMMSPHPVAKAAGAGMMAGQIIEKTLDVSDYSSSIGTKADQAVASMGGGETARTIAGVTATIVSTPRSIAIAIVDKVSGGRFAKWIGLK